MSLCGSVVLTAQKNARQNAEQKITTISHAYHLLSGQRESVKDKRTSAAGFAERTGHRRYNSCHDITTFHFIPENPGFNDHNRQPRRQTGNKASRATYRKEKTEQWNANICTYKYPLENKSYESAEHGNVAEVLQHMISSFHYIYPDKPFF